MTKVWVVVCDNGVTRLESQWLGGVFATQADANTAGWDWQARLRACAWGEALPQTQCFEAKELEVGAWVGDAWPLEPEYA